jgi:cell division septum initiation protein DivIVA
MSTVYNPESETIAQIERLELEAREVRRRIERSHNDEDRRALNRQLEEVQRQIDVLRARLP